jgi:serine/threonine-protein kinase
MEVGNRIGDYEIIQVLGAGGMGKVYKVRNVISDRVEAMKVLLPNLETDPELADRFLREIKVQASLDHPNIAGLHTALREGNQLLMLIEYVEGTTLESIAARGPLQVGQAISYISQVLEALAYAHARHVVHRDIKPANMMLTPEGVVKLMDFGIAKMADRRLTQTGRTVGSLYYMSPEQINGAQTLDGRADLYSLGVTLYQLVTGKRPFEGDSDYSIMAAHLQQNPIPPVQIDPSLPAALNDIILTAIAKDPNQRFQSADAFRNALQTVGRQLAGQPAQAAAPLREAAAAAAGPSPVPAPAPRSNRMLYMVVGSLVTVIALILAATQAPKFFSTEAQQKTAQEPAAPPAQQPAAPPVAIPAPEPAPTPAVAQEPLPTPAAQPEPAKPRPQPPAGRPSRPEPAKVQATQGVPAQPAYPPVTAPASQPSYQPAAQPPAQQAAQQPPAANRSAELRELRERIMMLGIRANTVKVSLRNLQQQNAARGLGVNGDMLSAGQRMEYFMDEAEGSLKSGDPDAAKKNLDMAERQVETLERFFGR